MSYFTSEEMEELKNLFVRIAEEKIKQMEEAIKSNDIDTVKTYAHQLKGAGGSYGFMEVSMISSEIEQRCCQNSRLEIAQLIQKLSEIVKSIKQNVNSK